MASTGQKSDYWNAKDYKAAADYVHKLTTKVLEYLDPQPADHILDVGCGDGPLTAKIASMCPQGSVHGLDKSNNFIQHAQVTHSPTQPNLTFELQDCSRLDEWVAKHPARYDKVFSNAALHWILRDPSRRAATFKAVFDVLKPGGVFIFEMGGAGNVSEVHAALIAALIHAGVPPAEAQDASPWFFPSEILLDQLLKAAGFQVEKAELVYRPTKMEEGAGGGVEGWVRLMGSLFLEKVDESKREAVIKEVCEVVKPVCNREEGGEWLGYTRARAVARRPS